MAEVLVVSAEVMVEAVAEAKAAKAGSGVGDSVGVEEETRKEWSIERRTAAAARRLPMQRA